MTRKTAQVGFIITKTIDFFVFMTIFCMLVLGKPIDYYVALGLVILYGVTSDLIGRFSMVLQGYKKSER